MNPLSIAAAAVMAATGVAAPAMAANVTIDRGEPFAIRQCPVDGEWGRYICYNESNTATVIADPANLEPIEVSRSRERVRTVDCDRRVDYRAQEVKGEVAAAYCPGISSLAPAPFLTVGE